MITIHFYIPCVCLWHYLVKYSVEIHLGERGWENVGMHLTLESISIILTLACLYAFCYCHPYFLEQLIIILSPCIFFNGGSMCMLRIIIIIIKYQYYGKILGLQCNIQGSRHPAIPKKFNVKINAREWETRIVSHRL